MKTYYIFRHGDTFVTEGKSLWGYGVRMYSAEILPKARPTLQKLGAYLKSVPDSFNASSEFLRCKQTVDIISKVSEKQFVFDKRLNEHFLEPFGRLQRRLQSFLDDAEKSSYENILICTHGACIAGLIDLLLTGSIRPFNFNYPMPGVLTIVREKSVQQISFNTVKEK